MDEIINHSTDSLVDEATLRALAKDSKAAFRSFLSRENESSVPEQLENYFNTLFSTALSSAISSAHRTACCNLICGTVEQCISSENPQVVAFGCSSKMCEQLERIYIDCYDNAKEKSMKQVLSTVVKVLSQSTVDSAASELLVKSLNNTFVILFQNHERKKAKPALHALNQYLLKNLVNSVTLVEHYDRWKSSASLTYQTHEGFTGLQCFILGVLDWVAVPDTAPSVGQLLSCFLISLGPNASNTINESVGIVGSPVWAEPLLASVSKRVDAVHTYRSYILPRLFKHDCVELWAFLCFLHVEDHLKLRAHRPLTTCADQNAYDSSTERLLLFSSLQVGKELGLIVESDHRIFPHVSTTKNTIYISDAVLGRLLDQGSSEARLAGLALLITSKRTTNPFTEETLSIIARNLGSFYGDPDPDFRSEVQSLIQTLVNRMRVITAGLWRDYDKCRNKKSIAQNSGEPISASIEPKESEQTLLSYQNHTKFLLWFLKFLMAELHPAASYQHHVSALKSLNILLKSGLDERVDESNLSRQAKIDVEWPLRINIINESMCRVLLDIFLDPFEDVRQAASDIFDLISPKDSRLSSFSVHAGARSALERAQLLMSQSGRVDHADGMARLYALCASNSSNLLANGLTNDLECYSGNINTVRATLEEIITLIEQSIEIAKHSLIDAVAKYSIHGYFTSLRYVIKQASDDKNGRDLNVQFMSKVFAQALQATYAMWECVKPILCDDAPEGFIPVDLKDESISTKDILSFAWRALRESSLLLQYLNSNEAQKFKSPLESEKFHRLQFSGDLCFSQLADLRHRGAFSTVAQTFTSICRQCAMCESVDIQNLLHLWYQDTLKLIERKGTVITRRSAGIPALLVAILSAEARAPSLERAIGDLTNLALTPLVNSTGQTGELPQVHALNSLKAIFINPKLVEQSERYIVKGMDIAASCLGSDLWSIRNCGLMLFRSLIDRLLGSNESLDEASSARIFTGSRISYDRYPGLLNLILRILSDANLDTLEKSKPDDSKLSSSSAASIEATFPVLDLLRRAPPPETHLSLIRRLILQACESKHWHIRDLAARTFTASVRSDEVVQIANNLLENADNSPNRLHGRLLVFKYLSKAILLGYVPLKAENGIEFFTLLVSTYVIEMPDNSCFLAKATSLAGINLFMQSLLLVETPEDERYSKHLKASELPKLSLLVQNRSLRSPLLLREASTFLFLYSLVDGLHCEDAPSNDELLAFPDLAISALESAGQMLSKLKPKTQVRVAESISSMLLMTKNAYIHRAGEKYLSGILEKLYDSKSQEFKITTKYLAKINPIARLEESASPNEMEIIIGIWGWSLLAKNQVSRSTISETALADEAIKWLDCLKISLHPSQELPLRYAAVRSLRALSSKDFNVAILTNEVFVAVALVVYDALNDDDDELRELAGEVSKVPLKCKANYSQRTVALGAVKASAQLRNVLLGTEATSPILFFGAMSRFFQQSLEHNYELQPVETTIQEIIQNDNVLFVIEKQNLYIDEVREATNWAKFLMKLPIQYLSKELLHPFTIWVIEGLDTLLKFAASQMDGPLGLTSKPDVFILGMRIIRGAEILLTWRTETRKIGVKASTVLKKLQELLNLGQATELHVLWMSTIQNVLQRAVMARLRILRASMERLPIEIC